MPVIDWVPAPKTGRRRGVALVLHGLNLAPHRMLPVAETARQDGWDLLLLSLRGHGENVGRPVGQGQTVEALASTRLDAFRRVHYMDWHAEALAAYRLARLRANADALPLACIGFSLGALLLGDLLISHPDVTVDRMVLFSPALRVRPTGRVMQLLAPFPGMVIPSFLAYRNYNANRGTTSAGYNAVFTGIGRLNAQLDAHAGRLNVPTLVMMQPRDELVSYRGVRRLVTDHHLHNWRIRPVQKDPTARRSFHHVVLDASCVGRETWATMQTLMTRHLRGELPAGQGGEPWSSRVAVAE